MEAPGSESMPDNTIPTMTRNLSLLEFSNVVFEAKDNAKVKDIHAVRFFDNFVDNGMCLSGQLTDTGKLSMQKMGANLRNLYVDKLKFIDNSKDVYCRSTDYARTIESLQYMLNGLFPVQYRDKNQSNMSSNLPIHIKVDETLYPNHNNQKAADLLRELKKQTRPQIAPLIEDLKSRLSKIGFPFSKMKDLHLINDYFICMKGNNVQLPPDLTETDLSDINKVCVKDWWGMYATSNELCKLSIGGMMRDLRNDIALPQPSKLKIYSGHDSTLGPLLSALGCFDDRIPIFSSIINIELFAERVNFSNFLFPKKEEFVRVLYDGKPVELPGCRGHGWMGDMSFCKKEVFLGIVGRLVCEDFERVTRFEKVSGGDKNVR